MATKIVLFFTLNNQGWSETYYPFAEFDTPDDARGVALRLASVRMKLCSNTVVCQAARISSTTRKRVALLDESVQSYQGQPVAEHHRDVANTAVLYRMTTADRQYSRQGWLRGIPDEWVNFTVSGRAEFSGTFFSAFRAWAQLIARIPGESSTTEMSIKAINKSEAVNAPLIISAITRSAAGNPILTVPGHSVTYAKEPVRISGCKFGGLEPVYELINGVHNVSHPAGLGLDENQVVLLGMTLPSGTVPYQGEGIMRTRRTNFFVIGHVDLVRFATHRTGRPTNAPRGRRPKGR